MSTFQDLYFIANPLTGMVKIGVSNDVQQRCYELSRTSGVPLVVLGTLARGGRHEKPLHAVFYESRMIGEWFCPTPDLLALVDAPQNVPAFIVANGARIAAGLAYVEQRRQRELTERAAAAAEKVAEAKALREQAKAAMAEASARGQAVAEKQRRKRHADDLARVARSAEDRAEFLRKRVNVAKQWVPNDMFNDVALRIAAVHHAEEEAA